MSRLVTLLNTLERQLMAADEAVTVAGFRLNSGDRTSFAEEILRVVAVMRAADQTVGALLRTMMSQSQESQTDAN